VPPPTLVRFVGGTDGRWQITRSAAVTGPPLPTASTVDVVGAGAAAEAGAWVLRGVTSNERYVERRERSALQAVQAPLGRPEATHAALIPIRKSPQWWDLTQDERRAVFEERSRHIAVGLRYLPAIARRLHHSRDLDEAFDFLTWFEFAPQDAGAFEDLVGRLRATEEWTFVDREVDIRLVLDGR
jgi:chlorite dismutase